MKGLTITRKEGERAKIGDDIWVQVTAIRGNRVRLTILAPEDMKISRPTLAPRKSQGDRP